MRIILGGLLFLFLGLANATDTMKLNVNKNQKTFMVTLPSNPTTGYQWTVVKFDKSFLKLSESKYIAPESKLIGAGGKMQFTFALISGKTYPARTVMVFKYLRSWEPEGGTLKRVNINFN